MARLLRKLRRLFIQFSVFFTVVILLWASAEGVARQIVRSIKWSADPYMLEYTDELIAKIYETDNPGFYREVLAEGWGGGMEIDYQPFVEYASRPRAGKHFNIREPGFRVPSGGATNLNGPNKRIFVFGGSTVFGMGVSDNETIPAYLQEAFREAGRDDVDVFNFSTVGYYSTQERILFERLINLGYVPDLTVFVDGLNDSISCDIPDTTGVSRRLEKAMTGGSGRTLAETYADRSNIVKLIGYYTAGLSVARDRPGATCTAEPQQIAAMVRRLDSNRRMIRGISDALGIRALFVQQPVTHYGFDDTLRPLDPPDVTVNKLSIRGFYNTIVAAREEGRLLTEDVLWLEMERIESNMYVDDVHYTPMFNQHLARQIFAHIADAI